MNNFWLYYLRHELLKIVGGRLADGINMVDQPGHTEGAQFLIEELHSELAWMVKWSRAVRETEYIIPFGQNR